MEPLMRLSLFAGVGPLYHAAVGISVSGHVRLGSKADLGIEFDLVRFRQSKRTWPPGSVCKPNCKPTTRYRTASTTTGQDRGSRSAEQEHTLSHCAAQIDMRILELENRCTGNRTVGSNPTLSAR